MSAAVTLDDLKCVLKDTDLSDESLQCFIDDACAWVDSLACLDDNVNKSIVAKYVAAHFALLADPRLLEEKFEGVTYKFERQMTNGSNILSTGYGQTANQFANGCLVEVAKRKPSFTFFTREKTCPSLH